MNTFVADRFGAKLHQSRRSQEIAHETAGRAVAVVARGGYLATAHPGVIDWDSPDEAADTPSYVRHRSAPEDLPFIVYAALWASATWTIENGPDDPDPDAALANAWDHAEDTDPRFAELAAQIDEDAFGGELAELWPAICAVAQMLLREGVVTHAAVEAAIAAAGPETAA